MPRSRTVIQGGVWVVLALAVTGAVVAVRPVPADTRPPGHAPEICRPCLTGTPYRGLALPFELDGENVRASASPPAR